MISTKRKHQKVKSTQNRSKMSISVTAQRRDLSFGQGKFFKQPELIIICSSSDTFGPLLELDPTLRSGPDAGKIGLNLR